MRNAFTHVFASSAIMLGTMLSTSTMAAKVGDVLRACDNVAAGGGSCNYGVSPAGDVFGCAQAKGSSNKTCFVCPGVSGGGQGDCVPGRKGGHPTRGGLGATLGGIKLPPASPKGSSPVNVGGLKSNGGTNTTGPGNQLGASGSLHSGSGRHK